MLVIIATLRCLIYFLSLGKWKIGFIGALTFHRMAMQWGVIIYIAEKYKLLKIITTIIFYNFQRAQISWKNYYNWNRRLCHQLECELVGGCGSYASGPQGIIRIPAQVQWELHPPQVSMISAHSWSPYSILASPTGLHPGGRSKSCLHLQPYALYRALIKCHMN